ncbi:carboxylating nicotinate-nucleotide diphosphorylase [Chloroflexota bacterium]
MELPWEQVDNLINLALVEDTGYGDPTSESLIPPGLGGRAAILAKANGSLAGIDVVRRVFLQVDPLLVVEVHIHDGAKIKPGDIIATVRGSVASIFKAERVALNFLQRLSGIATQAAQYVARVQGLAVKIVDTRKTTPGMRLLEKYAVRMGGAQNHRFHLGDAVLIKDNHLAALRALGMSLPDIVAKARENAPRGLTVEVEVNTTEEALAVVEAGADIVMLDNMDTDEMRRAVGLISGQAKIEASGGITLDNVKEVAMTGVDIISIGALTHSSKALDINLEFEPMP